MAELTNSELESLIERIDDPLQRATQALMHAPRRSWLAAKYGALLLETEPEPENWPRPRSGSRSSRSAPIGIVEVAEGLAEGDRSRLVLPLYERRIAELANSLETRGEEEQGAAAQEPIQGRQALQGLQTVVSETSRLGFTSDIGHHLGKYQDEIVALARATTREVNITEFVNALRGADYTSLPDRIAADQIQERLGRLRSPTQQDDLIIDYLVDLIPADRVPEERDLVEAYRATGLFGLTHRWGRTRHEVLSITDENREEATSHAWNIAQAYIENTGETAAVKRLWNDETFRENHGTDELARTYAKQVFAENLLNGRLNLAEETRETYRVRARVGPARDAILKHMREGKYETAQQISERFEVEIRDREYETVRGELEEQRDEHLQEGDLELAIVATERITRFDDFVAYGVGPHRLPLVDFTPNYHGKILTIEIGDRRIIRSGASMHFEILNNFREELQDMGLTSSYDERGGAHFRRDEHGRLLIHDRSVDFGECNKEEARAIVAEAFPDHEVLTEPYRGY